MKLNVKRKKIAGDPAIFLKTAQRQALRAVDYRISLFSNQTFF
ncbi:hypothetical protein HifGL_001300 [Haemophilus influenzae KR494]|nr:hypothetical protein HifGL_001300 [Haemophilus influenzae KR494]